METLVIESDRFGRIEAPSENVIEFDGLPGFPLAHRFVLLEHDRESLFRWLVCADEPELAFVVTDPRQFFPEYAPELPVSLASADAADSPGPAVLAIADVRGGQVHLNLAAPLVIDLEKRRATQVILEGSVYPVRQRVGGEPAGQTGEPPTPQRSAEAGPGSEKERAG
ncbi:MAG: flagellar assembly protein FliW [Myxococcota bacterium]|nr:flagellar assembly protein FliW [Myxococcota bacterium]